MASVPNGLLVPTRPREASAETEFRPDIRQPSSNSGRLTGFLGHENRAVCRPEAWLSAVRVDSGKVLFRTKFADRRSQSKRHQPHPGLHTSRR